MELLDVIEIHDRIAMHAEKTIWIEQRLEIFHASPNQMGRLPDMQPDVIPGRLHPPDIIDSYEHDLFIRFDCQSLQEAPRQLWLLLVTRISRSSSIRALAIC
jgi:hypothetical protein